MLDVRDDISFPHEAPAAGVGQELAPDVLWLRLPLKMRPDHVNVYVLADDDGWTVIDTGLDTPELRVLWQQILAGPLAGRPVARVLVTHQHPDHIGLAGWFQTQGASLITTRHAWTAARMLWLDRQETLPPETLLYLRRAGMPAAMLAERAAQRPYNSADRVHELPLGFTRITQGQMLRLGGRDWIVRMGDGHAPEHATLWERHGNLVIGGDQFLPGISPNLGVYATEPDADPVGDWIASCERFLPLARPDQLVLPGHKLPYHGLPTRLRQMRDSHVSALIRLHESLRHTPRTAVDCFDVLYRRRIGDAEFGLALAEAVGHINYLRRRHLIEPAGETIEGGQLWRGV